MSQPPRSILGIITAVTISFVAITYFLSFLIAALAIITTQLGPKLLALNGYLPLEVVMLLIRGVLPANALVLVVTSMAVFALCFWAAAKDRGGFLSGLKALTMKTRPTTTPNWLIVMPLLSSALLIVTLIFSIFLNSAGVPVGNLPQNDQTQLFASITYAPIAEETGFRISVIGLVVAIRTLLPLHRGRGLATAGLPTVVGRVVLAFLSPDRAKEAAGLQSIGTYGWRGIHSSEWFFLLFTSLVFGIDHSLSGAGWGPGKALTAGMSGFALAIVYLWYGAYANILLHWFFDFYNFVIFGALLAGILPILLADLSIIAALFLSVVAFVFGFRWLRPRKPTLAPPTISYNPAPQ